ncbi:MAG: M28 family peptidase [Actinomycetota bacterium]
MSTTWVAAVFVGVVLPSGAGPVPDSPIARVVRIAHELDEAIGEDAVRDEITALATVAPHRRAGTPFEIVARDWVYRRFLDAGLSNVRIEESPYLSWQPRRVGLFDSSASPADLEVRPIIGSPNTLPTGLTAPIVYVGRGESADYAKLSPADYVGRIHVVRRGGTHRFDKYIAAVQHGAVGFVFAHDVHEPDRNLIETGSIVPLTSIPAVAIGAGDGDRLEEAWRNGIAPEVTLVVDAESRPSVTWNVIGEIPAAVSTQEFVVFGTHYDSHDVGPSVADNAAGMGATIAAARVLASRWSYARTIRVIAFGAEEIGLQGSVVHAARTAPDILASCRLMADIDVAGNGDAGAALNATGSPRSETATAAAMVAAALEYERRSGYGFKAETGEFPAGYASASNDSASYAVGGCPTLALNKWPFAHYHTQYDTLDEIDWSDARLTAVIAASIVAEYALGDDLTAGPTLRGARKQR